MRFQNTRKRICIYFNSKERVEGRSLIKVLKKELFRLQVSPIAVFFSQANWDTSSKSNFWLRNRRLMVQIIETEQKTAEILALCDRIIPNGMVTVEEITLIRYASLQVSKEDQKIAESYQSGKIGQVKTDLEMD